MEYTGKEIFKACLSEEEQKQFETNIDNFDEYMERKFTSLSMFVDRAFTWSVTPEGQTYWSNISSRRNELFHFRFEGEWFNRETTDLVHISEHSESEYAGQKIPKQRAFECIESGFWFHTSEGQEVRNGHGNTEGYISEYGLNENPDRYTYSEYHDYLILSDYVIHADDEDGCSVVTYEYNRSIVRSDRDERTFTDSDAANSNGYYYNDYIGDYIHEDDDDFNNRGDDVSSYNSGYHSLSRLRNCERDTKFTVGFEIEKEDNDAGCRYHYEKLHDETKWCKENDGSLGGDGYELISPIYDLFDKKLDVDIERKDLKELINADYDTNTCGGHINLGSSIYSVEELFEGLSQFYPLLYSMYPHRIEVDYSKAKKKHSYYQKEKYSAIYMKSNVLEFRIFSAVKNTTQLIWRRDLIRIFVENINKSEADVLRMLVDSRSKLYKHLRKVYSQDQLIDKIELFVNHVREWNNKQLPKPNISKMKKDKLDDGLQDNEAA